MMCSELILTSTRTMIYLINCKLNLYSPDSSFHISLVDGGAELPAQEGRQPSGHQAGEPARRRLKLPQTLRLWHGHRLQASGREEKDESTELFGNT